ncbi:MAG: hypothetical protein ACOXZO_01140 [Bacteroidales bacterium]|jgi:hypothetical protein|nr:hypothetical protein [Bacteroidales bacterium]
MTQNPSYRRILHRMGYYNYQQGLINNFLVQENGWLNHQQKCRNFILKAIEYFKPGKITVLGSGWLMELPLIEMVEQTDEICLVDIIHPPEVVTQVSSLKKVKLIKDDVSGGLIEKVWEAAGRRTFLNRLKSLDGLEVPEYSSLDDPGLVISLNILTQIEVLPLALLRKKAKVSEDEYLLLRKKIQSKHLEYIKQHDSVIISDISELITRIGGKTEKVNTLLVDLPEGILRDNWQWDVDLKGRDYNLRHSSFEVTAVIL